MIEALYQWLGVAVDFKPPSRSIRVNQAIIDQDIPEDVRTYLEEYYRPHNKALEQYLQRDLSIWGV
jgi:hypothetical protein